MGKNQEKIGYIYVNIDTHTHTKLRLNLINLDMKAQKEIMVSFHIAK